MQDLQHFKNDITLILSRERLDTYDSLEQYKENLKLISFITPKISSLEIYLRNALDYCLFVGSNPLGITYFCEIFKSFLSGNCIFILCFLYDAKISLSIDSSSNALWIFFFTIACW